MNLSLGRNEMKMSDKLTDEEKAAVDVAVVMFCFCVSLIGIAVVGFFVWDLIGTIVRWLS